MQMYVVSIEFVGVLIETSNIQFIPRVKKSYFGKGGSSTPSFAMFTRLDTASAVLTLLVDTRVLMKHSPMS